MLICLVIIYNVEMMKMSRADRIYLLIRGTPTEHNAHLPLLAIIALGHSSTQTDDWNDND
jgi:hypothetical protein